MFFVEIMISKMINFISSDDYVNELIKMLYDKSIGNNIDLTKINKNDIPKKITDVDMFLYGYVILLYEYTSFIKDEDYKKIVKELYYRLDNIIYNDKQIDKDIKNINVKIKLEYE